MYNGELINKDYSDMMLDIMKLQLDNSMMKFKLSEDIVVANKTGELSSVNHDVGIVYTENSQYIFIMMTWDLLYEKYGKDINNFDSFESNPSHTVFL
jgi:beta-lactamase class A